MFQKDAMTFEWRRCFFAEGYFQKYLQALCKYIEKCSAEGGFLEMQKYWEMTIKEHSEVFCKTNDIGVK